MQKDLYREAEQQTEKEIYGTARKYARLNVAYEKYLIGEPPSPVRYCIEEAQKCIEEADLSSGYDFIRAEDDMISSSLDLVREPRKYSSRACRVAAWNYRAAANWYTMAAELARREDDQNDLTAPLPPQPEH